MRLMLCVIVQCLAAVSDTGDANPPRFEEEVVVVGERLKDKGFEENKIPAAVSVYTAEDIKRLGARTLQEFFTFCPELNVFDEVGNGAQATVDIRGFNAEGGSVGVGVFVDGVRANEADMNTVHWELIPLAGVERIEIVRGPFSALYGGGATGGAIHIFTKRAEKEGYNILADALYGEYGVARAVFGASGKESRYNYLSSLERSRSDGWRRNGDYRLTNFSFNGGATFGQNEWTLFFRHHNGNFRQPGALLPEEIEEDPAQNPFNELDYADNDSYAVSLEHRFHGEGKWSTVSMFSFRDFDSRNLTTGRWGFGFLTEDSSKRYSAASQARFFKNFSPRLKNTMVFGADLSRDGFRGSGFFTDSTLDGEIDAYAWDSSADAVQDAFAVFFHDIFEVGKYWSFSVGARYDRVEFDYEREEMNYFTMEKEKFSKEKSFDELSPSVGANFNLSEKHGFFANFSQAFLSPAAGQMFAYRFFGSNENLKPARSRGVETGWRARWTKRFETRLNIFSIRVRDEIFYVITDPVWFIGINDNAGETLRRGAEFSLRGAGKYVRAHAGYAYIDAEFRSSFDAFPSAVEAGKTLPQIPKHKISAGIDVYPSKRWRISARNVYADEQFVTSDYQNSARKIPPYNVLNLTAAYTRSPWECYLEIHNALDRRYATRGIVNGAGQAFYTPASPMRVSVGVKFNLPSDKR